MKQTKRIFALFLCLVLLLSLVGCQIKPADDVTATEDPYRAERELYQQMRSPIDSASNLILNINTVKTTSVGGETFTERTDKTAVLTGVGTNTLQVYSTENIIYNEAYAFVYEETFSADTLYVRIRNSQRFYGTIAADKYVQRFPAILLDASLYSTIIKDEGAVVTELKFSDPTAGESWALPEGAELIEASGAAIIRGGTLESTSYKVTYLYGPATIALEVNVAPKLEAKAVTPPADSQSFIKLDAIEAARYYCQAVGYLLQTNNIGVTCSETFVCQAAGSLKSQTSTTYFHGVGTNLIYKGTYNTSFVDLFTQKSESWVEEDTYLNGIYTYSVDGEEAKSTTLDTMSILSHRQTVLFDKLTGEQYWENATAADLGTVYLFEFTFNDAIGEILSSNVNLAFYDDPNYLDSYVSSFSTNGLTGYLAIDKYTGLPTSSGVNLAGTQTIDGHPYILSHQLDQAIDVPCLSAYKEITGKLPTETEPESKATPLFYKVTGKDGQQMWLLGTIHVGDARTGFLPEEIYKAFNSSDALALELNTNAFEKRLENDQALQERMYACYTYSDGSTTAAHLDKELYDYALQYMKASGKYSMTIPYLKVSIWEQYLRDFFLRQGYQLTSDQGVDNRLLTMAEEKGMKILDVENPEEHVKITLSFSDELQEFILDSLLEEKPCAYWQEAYELFEMWCDGNESDLREFINTNEDDIADLTEEEKQLYMEYNQAMNLDRNREMLQVATNYLESGETVFFAVGLAHLLGEEGLVDTLRDSGYTVELVPYAQ